MKFEQLSKKMTAQGLKPYSYSGRFMYGESCLAVNVSNLAGYNLPSGWKQDNMGRGYVIYWPTVIWKNTM